MFVMSNKHDKVKCVRRHYLDTYVCIYVSIAVNVC